MNRSEQSMLGRLSRCGLTAALVASALMAACSPAARPMAVAPTPSFVFRSLDLSQRADNGDRDWDLTSPEARYDLSSRTIRARRPEGLLYQNDQPRYRITADLATVLRDGELVVLEGIGSAAAVKPTGADDRGRQSDLDAIAIADGDQSTAQGQ